MPQLRRRLRAGRSLAQLARERAGRSESGLISAVEAAQRGKLAKKSAKLLSKRVTAEVRAPGSPVVAGRVHSLRITAATYLGLSVTALRDATRAGKSLGQVAQETGGKSEAGLIEALVAVRKNGFKKTSRPAVSARAKRARW